MLVIGLTGGIGSGKSTVTKLFAKHKTPILDADATAHQLSKPDQAGYRAILKHFGPAILNDDKQIDRQKLGQLIFNDESAKKQLEAILHPMILKHIQAELAKLKQTDTAYCIVDIPLITARNQFTFLDRVLVVDCPVALQVSRTKKRDQIDEKAIYAILNQQCSREQRLKFADDILLNEDSLETLSESVGKLHKQYLSAASK